MDEIAQPHDHFLKSLLEQPTVAATLLRERLPPAVVARLTEDTPELMPGTFIESALRESRTDRLFRVRRKDGGNAYIYCLIEHKSAPDRWLPLQLLRYLVAVWERMARQSGYGERLPMIVPLVVYHGDAPWTGARRFSDLVDVDDELRGTVLDFPFELLDAGHVPEPELSQNPWLRAGLMLLRYAKRFPPGPVEEVLARVFELLKGMPTQFLITVVVYILTQYAGVTESQLNAALRRAMPEEGEQMLSKAAQDMLASARDEARKEGRKEGVVDGERKGRADGLMDLLNARFGRVPSNLSERIKGANLDQLHRWFERAITVATIDDVFRD